MPKRITEAQLQEIWMPLIVAVANATNIGWAITSVIRNSPSHKRARAIDIAPRPDNVRIGGGIINPFLNFSGLKTQLEAAAQSIENASRSVLAGYAAFDCILRTVGLFIEDDHIHMQAFEGCSFVKRHLVDSGKNYRNRSQFADNLKRLIGVRSCQRN